MGDGERLAGGYISEVWRVGETVRRTWPGNATYVHDVLAFLADAGYAAAPRFLGRDDEEREVLSFVDGVALTSAEPLAAWEVDAVGSVARLVREFHDLTAGSPIAGDGEVVCHNDLSPKNTIYTTDGLRPVAFIDWDQAAPGRRIEDVAHVAWQWACRATTPSPDVAIRNLLAIADGYGLASADRAVLVEEIVAWQRRCWLGIQAGIDAGDPRMARLAEVGAVGFVQADEAWTVRHRRAFESALA